MFCSFPFCFLSTHPLHTCTHARTHARSLARTHAHKHTHARTHGHTHTRTHTHAHARARRERDRERHTQRDTQRDTQRQIETDRQTEKRAFRIISHSKHSINTCYSKRKFRMHDEVMCDRVSERGGQPAESDRADQSDQHGGLQSLTLLQRGV